MEKYRAMIKNTIEVYVPQEKTGTSIRQLTEVKKSCTRLSAFCFLFCTSQAMNRVTEECGRGFYRDGNRTHDIRFAGNALSNQL